MTKSTLSVQSFCFRNFKDNNDTAKKVDQIGLKGIEICGIHCDFNNIQDHRTCLDTYGDNGIRVISIGVNNLSSREANTPIFEFAKTADLKAMSVSFNLDQDIEESLKTADEMAEEYGVNLGIHNHGGTHWLGNKDALNWVYGKTSSRIGLSLDTAWALAAKADPIDFINSFSDRLYILHLKDFIFERDGSPEDVVVGTGNINLAEMQNALLNCGFQGEAVIEYEGDPADPVPALTECVAKIKTEMNEIFAV
ncbi:MAG: sugar phosphate isomerase/epimerase [Spirochaetales bacterium]|jgi:inosose dehydratase|nr:sugar phosphate isomerase/epimerase [Spirochaetales bacterium]